MPNEITRMRQLAGLIPNVEMDDEAMADFEAQEEREEKVTQYITNTFRRLSIAISEDGVTYDEHPDKFVMVVLDDEPMGFSISKLNQLYETGLSDDFHVAPNDQYTVKIEFKLSDMVYQVLSLH